MSPKTESNAKPSAKRSSRKRKIARVQSIDTLVGAHPDSLRDIYESGSAYDPTANREMESRLLAIDALQGAYMLTRPLVVKAARSWLPWRGTRFESGGTAGEQLLAAGRRWRFSTTAAPSRLDGVPTLRLCYANLGNPGWVAGLEQELRYVGDQVAIGPVFRGSSSVPIAWTGLSG